MRRLKFELSFNMDNSAFSPSYKREEVARCLLDVHNRVLHDLRTDGTIRDSNGNTIGQWSMDEDDDA